MAHTTKKALATSLKKLLQEKKLDKITVVDIVEDCAVNRQTFYYHFKDIYDLAEWMLTTENLLTKDGKNYFATWQEAYMQIFQYILDNKQMTLNIYHSSNKMMLQRFLYSRTYEIISVFIDEQAGDIKVDKEDKSFLAKYFEYGFVGLVLDWIETGMKENPECIVEKLSILIQGDLKKSLKRFRKDKKLDISL